MACFIPCLEKIKTDQMEKHTEGELALLNALQALSDDFQVYFQPHINFAHPDVIILHKTGGILIIEVKDWNLDAYQFCPGDKIQNDYLLLRNEPGKIRSPFTQADDYKKELYSILKSSILEERVRLGNDEKKIYGVIKTSVFFYNASQSDVKKLYHAADLFSTKYGANAFREYYYYWCREDLKNITNSITDLIGKPHPFFSDKIQEAANKILTLSEEWLEQSEPFDPEKLNLVQKELIKPNQSFVRVKGSAGSGKTLVLAFKALNCYKLYKSPVLILTYNITLRNYIYDAIARQTRDMSQRERFLAFEIIHYDAFIPQVFKKINVEGPQPNNYMDSNGEIDWKQYHRDADHLLKSHKDLISKYNCQYKTILIDEAQDYEREWFELIEECFLLPQSDFFIVADQMQNIYHRIDFMDKLPVVPGFRGPWRSMPSSYRLAHEMILLAKDFKNTNMLEYGNDEINEIKTNSEGTIEYFDLQGRKGDINRNIWNIVDSFGPNGNNIARNDICVLFGEMKQIRNFEYTIRKMTNDGIKFQMMCETHEEYNDIVKLSNGNKRQVKSELRNIRYERKRSFRMNPGTVKLCTIHSFKGWEINTVVIVLDNNPEIHKEHIYTALTRAKTNLLIIDLGRNDYGPYFKHYVEKIKRRVPIPEGYRISEKPSDHIFSTKYGICKVLERIDRNGLKIVTDAGKEISFLYDYYNSKNQAYYVVPISP